MREVPPLTASAVDVNDCVDDFTHNDLAWPPAFAGFWQQRPQQSPLFIAHVGWVWFPFHTISL
jgi:hypothetical protein